MAGIISHSLRNCGGQYTQTSLTKLIGNTMLITPYSSSNISLHVTVFEGEMRRVWMLHNNICQVWRTTKEQAEKNDNLYKMLELYSKLHINECT